MSFKRHCGTCGQYTEQTYSDKSGKWVCDLCNTRFDNLPGCVMEFAIKGTMVPKGRPRATIRGEHAVMYTPKNTVQFEQYVKQAATQYAPPILLSGALDVHLSFYMQRPQSLPNKIQYHTKRPDIDNLTKSVLDALEGVIYERDSQIYLLNVTKEYGIPRCEVRIVEELEL